MQQISSVGDMVANVDMASPDEAAGPICLTEAGRELQVRVSKRSLAKRRRPPPQQNAVQGGNPDASC